MRVRTDRLTQVVAWLFMIGSACFAIGAFPWYFRAVSPSVDAATFFVGSLFFTSASYGQMMLAQDALQGAAESSDRRVSLRFRSWAPRDLNWVSALAQLIGTLYFNVTTFVSTLQNLTLDQKEQHIWRPDFIGSILFLVSSAFALAVLGSTWRRWRPHERPWSMAWLNMAGSIAFMASAIASFIVPSTGEVLDMGWVNLGTCAGAICFFIGAALLLPRTRTPSTTAS